MIDQDGYRANVGIIILNDKTQVFWGKRPGQNAWQFPQGGVDENETSEQAMYRELQEEVGLEKQHVEILDFTKEWFRYRIPHKLQRTQAKNVCIGQKQRWYLLKLVAPDSVIDLALSGKPEFQSWMWVSYWYPLNNIVMFKRNVYRRALKALSPRALGCPENSKPGKPLPHLLS